MICYQGESVWPLNKGVPSLYSIGVSLGRVPRFCGHTAEHYTVLGHVLTVAAILPDEYALFGLLHDAPEACVGDVPTPWKTSAAKKREHVLLRRIYADNGLKFPISEEAQAKVDWADKTVLAAEAHALGHAAAQEIWPWDEAELADAHELTRYHLSNVPSYLVAEIAGPIYEQAFEHYLDLALLSEEQVAA